MPATERSILKETGETLFDVIIVGAGLSGIGTAYRLQEKCPGKNFAILEARDAMGGTWDLFQYPGIRSDSDMFTFGYRFRPWKAPGSLSDGASILHYLRETAVQHGIDKKICFGYKVIRASWSGKELCWTIHVQVSDENRQIRSRFLYMCSGYYSYDEAYRPVFTGEENFRGKIILPQFWPKGLDYAGRQVVVVGSGATAVTLVPKLAETAGHVTMLQRSPTYIINMPDRNRFYIRLKKWLPELIAYRLSRWRNLLLSIAFYKLSRSFPGKVKSLIVKYASRQLDPGYPVDKHFNPRYNPWDQRLCIAPDGDFFKSIRKGKAAVVTGEIAQFTHRGVLLQSGEELPADIIVLATGLQLKLFGGVEISVNGKLVDPNELMVYKGMMFSDMPNFAIAFGYTNASWTLKTDLTANYVCRLLAYMDKKGYGVVTPRRQRHVAPAPFTNFQPGYIRRAGHMLPMQGSHRPWRVYQNYLADMLATRYGRIADGVLEFTPIQR